jgi:PAS domain S-box-containing protein
MTSNPDKKPPVGEFANLAGPQSEQLLQKILDSLPVGVWLVNSKGHIAVGNPAGVEIWGGAKYVGLEEYGIYQGWWPDSGLKLNPEEWSAARAVTKGETVLNQVVEIETFDGKRKTISNSAVPLIDPSGRIQGAIVVVQDVTDRARYEKALHYGHQLLEASRTELRTLSRRFEERVEEERKTISAELRDQLAQTLIGVKMALASMAENEMPAERLRDRARELSVFVDDTIQSIKELTLGLRPFLLDHVGLVAALESQAQLFQQRTGISCVCELPQEDPLRSDPITSMSVFRILEEALANVEKHAQATELVLSFRTAGQQACLEIRDNGTGIPTDALLAPESLGLAGMRERANSLGGELRIDTSPQSGTRIMVCLPLAAAKQ